MLNKIIGLNSFLIIIPYGLLFILAVLGNAIVIVTLLKHKRVHTITNIYLINLAISDLILAVMCMPITLMAYLLKKFIFDITTCKIILFLQALSISSSVWTLVTISLERYFAICKPLFSRRWQTITHSLKIILLVWIWSIVNALPILLVSGLKLLNVEIVKMPIYSFSKSSNFSENVNLSYHPNYQYQNIKHKTFACREIWPNSKVEGFFNWFLNFSLLIFPLIIMVYAYSKICMGLWKAAKYEKKFHETITKHDEKDYWNHTPLVKLNCSKRYGNKIEEKLDKTLAKRSYDVEKHHVPNNRLSLHTNPIKVFITKKGKKNYKYKTNNLYHENSSKKPSNSSKTKILTSTTEVFDYHLKQTRLWSKSLSNPQNYYKPKIILTTRRSLPHDKAIIDSNLKNYTHSDLTPLHNIFLKVTHSNKIINTKASFTYDYNLKHEVLPSFKKIKKHMARIPSTSNAVVRRYKTEDGFSKSLKTKKKIIKMLCVIVIEFFLCWTPLYVINTWLMHHPESLKRLLNPSRTSIIFHFISHISVCCNPITYCFMNPKFRQSLADILSSFRGGIHLFRSKKSQLVSNNITYFKYNQRFSSRQYPYKQTNCNECNNTYNANDTNNMFNSPGHATKKNRRHKTLFNRTPHKNGNFINKIIGALPSDYMSRHKQINFSSLKRSSNSKENATSTSPLPYNGAAFEIKVDGRFIRDE
ncbi:unnamed protein product [Gordionus sp. m RMFG-2023]|uniref:uncharacterized protein LOC135924387 n=1 Tax=Gordionus sp. m RMFG-2023 TaxID=3053472 RepID=UPI0030E432BE